MDKKLFILIFVLGFLSAYFINYSLLVTGLEKPFGFSFENNVSPFNWLNEEDIIILHDKVILNIKNASLSRYADSGSMIPVLDKGTNGIRIKPESEKDIHIGDIITYEKQGDLIVHRVVDIGEDEQGVYFIMKGDNNELSDGKVRFKDIKYVTIALVY